MFKSLIFLIVASCFFTHSFAHASAIEAQVQSIERLFLEDQGRTFNDLLFCIKGEAAVYKVYGTGTCISLINGEGRLLNIAGEGLSVGLSGAAVIVAYKRNPQVKTQKWTEDYSVSGPYLLTFTNQLRKLTQLYSITGVHVGPEIIIGNSEAFGRIAILGVSVGAGVNISKVSIEISGYPPY